MNLIIRPTSSLKFQFRRGFYVHKNFLNNCPFLHYVGIRKLISPSYFYLDKFLQKRKDIQGQFVEARQNFIKVMRRLYQAKESPHINSEDLKNMIFICEQDEFELQLLQHMIRNFIPVESKYRYERLGLEYLKLLYVLKLPNEMRKVLNEKELSSLFREFQAYLVAMSLFYNYKLYKDVINVYHKLKSEIQLQRNQKLPTMLAIAACYHMNSSWSLNEASSIIKEREEMSARLDPRSLSFAAALALKQDHTYEALEFTSKTHWNSFLLKNLKILALIGVRREEDALPVLRGYSGGFVKHPSKVDEDNIVLQSTMSSLEKALSLNLKNEALSELNIIKKDLIRKSLIKNISLEKALNEPVEERHHFAERAKKTMIVGSFQRGKDRAKAQKDYNRVGFTKLKH